MPRAFLIIVLVLFAFQAEAQEFAVGHKTVTFNDSLRTGGFGSGGGPGRQIQSEIYYPALAAGENMAIANGLFPVVVFGHGFLIGWEAYRNIWELLVPRGYILIFPRTESGMNPNHSALAEDMVLCASRMQSVGAGVPEYFSGKVAPFTALMGHSMGGGCAFLGAADNELITTVIGLAPLETRPTASTAASSIVQPCLIFSGTADGVTSPSTHHQPIYDNLASFCKYLISITGGAHCFFANPNLSCDVGEMLVSGDISITRTNQQTILNDYLIRWLDFTLRNNEQSRTDFVDLLVTDRRITWLVSCSLNAVDINNPSTFGYHVYPNPAREELFINGSFFLKPISYQVQDISGRLVLSGILREQSNSIDLKSITGGLYLVRISDGATAQHFKLLIQK